MVGREMDEREKLNYLWDRQQIRDVIHLYSRGVDRHDVELMLKVFHPDAIDEHGNDVNGMPDFTEWANKVHEDDFGLHLHNITTHNCEIVGDVAHCETYVLAGLATKDGRDIWLIGGRYLDRLTRISGEWKIAFRRTMIDWLSKSANIFTDPLFASYGYPTGTWDKTDASYQRPFLRSNK